MAKNKQDWEALGRNIQDAVDRAINSHDYQKLNQTIRQTVETVVDIGNETVRKVRDNVSRPATVVETQPVAAEKKNLPVLYGNTGGKTAGGVLKIVGGGLLSVSCFLGLLGMAALNRMLIQLGTAPLVLLLTGFGGGVALICSGINTLGHISRFKLYRKILGQKTHCTLEKLARSVGKSVKFVRREVQKMIREGLFLQGHLDKEQTSLITSHETYRLFEQSRLQLEARQKQERAEKAREAAAAQNAAPKDSRVQEVLDKGNAFIAEIRRCNDAIPGLEISAKIDRMENIVRRIFQRAQAHPEIVPDLKKMMDYYLPMTVKLLNAYADMDAQPIQGETIELSKREIEQTLDTLNLAFEKLLDDLFKDTALDVSSDISVLQTLLAQEGLMDDEFTKMKNRQNGNTGLQEQEN